MVENTGEKTLKNEEADSKKEQIEDVFIVPIGRFILMCTVC